MIFSPIRALPCVLIVLPFFLTQYLIRNSLCLLLGFLFRQVLELQLLKQSIWLIVKTSDIYCWPRSILTRLYQCRVWLVGMGAQTCLGLHPHFSEYSLDHCYCDPNQLLFFLCLLLTLIFICWCVLCTPFIAHLPSGLKKKKKEKHIYGSWRRWLRS